MRSLLVSLLFLAAATAGAWASDATDKPEPPPPPSIKLEPVKQRPIAIHDGTHKPNGPDRSCEPNAMGQLECKASAQ